MTATRSGPQATSIASPPSGRQHVITHGDQRAVITQVGATLREFTVRGVPVIDGFEVAQRSTDGRGQVLAPWPNRLADGRYEFDGQKCQAALNEPGPGNAIHGLVRWLDWAETRSATNTVTLQCVLRPQPAYEWQLRLEIRYALGDGGLTVSATVVNIGDTARAVRDGIPPLPDRRRSGRRTGTAAADPHSPAADGPRLPTATHERDRDSAGLSHA